MTEQELRRGLQEHLASADLPDCRKQALLASLREEAAPAPVKGDTPMFRPNKFRTALVVALIVTLLSATVALGTSLSGYVNFQGQPVDDMGTPVPTPMPPEEQAKDEAYLRAVYMDEILRNSPRDQLTRVTLKEEDGSSGTWMPPRMTVNSLEELAAQLPEEITLPKVPEGYTFNYAEIYFDCAADSAYELVRDETLEDGSTIKGYRIPEGKRVARDVNYYLSGEMGDISVSLSLDHGTGYYFGVSNAQSVETPDIPGMDEAILIVKPTSARLTMQRKLDNPIPIVDPVILHGRPDALDMTLTHLVITLYSPSVPTDVLLGMMQ